MKERRILNILGQVNEEYIEEATPINRTFDTQTIKFNRRLPIALIAAILALLLMGAGVVVAIYGNSIQSWFSYYWEEITGQPMSEEQVSHRCREANDKCLYKFFQYRFHLLTGWHIKKPLVWSCILTRSKYKT